MMNWIVRTALNLRAVVVVLGIVLMIVGLQTIRSTPLDVFPEFAPPLVEIQTEAPGLSTAEVESLIIGSDRERRERHVVAEDPAIEVRPRSLVRRADLPGRHRPHAGAPARAGAARDRGAAGFRTSPIRPSSCRRSRRRAGA